jgi:RHS repeat-associated protein
MAPNREATSGLGSASVVTNATGTTIEQESDYYPYGGERVLSAGANNYKFSGKERDVESGLDDFEARHYSSALGRFMQPDEFAGGPVEMGDATEPAGPLPYADIANPQSLNKYSYTYNNPLSNVDPTGHCATTLTFPVCAGGMIGGPPGAAIGLGVGIVATVALAAYLYYRSDNSGGSSEQWASERPTPPTTGSGSKEVVAPEDQAASTGHSQTVGHVGVRKWDVRVDVEGGSRGNVHVQIKGPGYTKGKNDKIEINKPEDIDKLPKALRKNRELQRLIKKGWRISPSNEVRRLIHQRK